MLNNTAINETYTHDESNGEGIALLGAKNLRERENKFRHPQDIAFIEKKVGFTTALGVFIGAMVFLGINLGVSFYTHSNNPKISIEESFNQHLNLYLILAGALGGVVSSSIMARDGVFGKAVPKFPNVSRKEFAVAQTIGINAPAGLANLIPLIFNSCAEEMGIALPFIANYFMAVLSLAVLILTAYFFYPKTASAFESHSVFKKQQQLQPVTNEEAGHAFNEQQVQFFNDVHVASPAFSNRMSV